MKAICTLVIALFSILNTDAQVLQLYGTAKEGGKYAGGTIFSINGDGSNFLKRYDFEQDAGYQPEYTRLLDGGDGYLYGLTSQGGYYSDGVIFRINIQNRIVEIVHQLQNFPDSVYLNNHKEGSSAQGSLIMATNGLMYGMCKSGGTQNRGTIFTFNPVSFNYDVVYNFIDSNSNSIQESGKAPYGSLTQVNDSIFYGLTYHGGINNGNGGEGGVLFKFNLLNKKYTSVYDFTAFPSIASNPAGDLLMGNNGWLYGTAGGPNGGGWGNDGKGILFRYNPAIDSMERLIDFNDDTIAGKYPNGILTQAANGWIYGTTRNGNNLQGGGGEIFAFDPATHQSKLVHKFADPADGYFPVGGLTEASDGWLYGTTTFGGQLGYGSVFKLNPLTDSVIILKFMNNQEINTQSTFIQLPGGDLYSISTEGGEEMNGTIFKYSPVTSSLETIFEFRVSDHGCHPTDGLVQNANGKIYGFTHEGGNFHAGVMFGFDTGVDEYFEYREDLDAAYLPRGTLSPGPNGKYYGAALYHFDGGATIYSFNPVTLQYKIEKELGDNLFGEKPAGKMVMLSDGNFYGTMSRGGTQDYGTIYRFNPMDTTYDVLYDAVDSALGIHPTGSFAVWNGKLFGMMDQGGIAGQGTLFRFDPVLQHYDKMIDFVDSINGKNPSGRLIVGADGLLYGNTYSGGAKKDGTLFSYNPQTNQLITLVNFDAATIGSKPRGTLLQASDEALYGTTSLGGNFNYGTVFRYEPSTADYLVIHHFNNIDGRYPEGELMEFDPSLTAVDEATQSIAMNAYPNPFSDYTTINIETTRQENLVAVITDLEGKTLLRQRVLNKSFIIGRNNLPAGAFFLQVMNENEVSVARMKLLIQ